MIAVIEFLWDGWRPHYAVLGRVDGVRGYHDITRYPEARLVPGPGAVPLGRAAVLRQCRAVPASACWRRSRHRRRRCGASWSPPSRSPASTSPRPTCWPSSSRRCSGDGIELRFAEMKDPVKDKLRALRAARPLGEENFHPTVGAAVDAYVEEYAVDWKD